MDDIKQATVHMGKWPFVWLIRIVLTGLLLLLGLSLLVLATVGGGFLAVRWELRRLFVEDVELA